MRTIFVWCVLITMCLTLTACVEEDPGRSSTQAIDRAIYVQGCDATLDANDDKGVCRTITTTCALDRSMGERTQIGPVYQPAVTTGGPGCAVYQDGAICPLTSDVVHWLTRQQEWTRCTSDDEAVLHAQQNGPIPPESTPPRFTPFP
ncbi:MAG: hypothetical protein CMH57_15730 [Myxococcales bacterium]|nr:hypothetical protein [Myxococcales bacterium]